MDATQEVDVEKIMERVRESIRNRQSENPVSEAEPLAANDHIIADLASLHTGYDIYHIPFTSHRKAFGWVAVLAKKVLRQLLTPILMRQLDYNAANTRVTTGLRDRLEQLRQGFEYKIQQMERRQTEASQQQVAGLQSIQQTVEAHVRNLGQQQAATLQALQETVLGHIWRLGQQQEGILQGLRTEMDQRQEAILQGLRTEMDQRQEMVLQRFQAAFRQVEEMGRRLEMDIAQLKASLSMQERRLTMLLEEARKHLPESDGREQLQLMDGIARHILDGLYLTIEDRFRGSREEIQERFRTYLPIIEKAKLGTAEMPILDIGCGRGEWLELLRENGYCARGVDMNPVLIELCRERQLDVTESDAITYLRTLPDACLGALTGFHIVEHLPFATLVQLFDETVRVLKPGGAAIFETPNPQNVLVGSCNFYLDPTHGNPLPSQLLHCIAEARGLRAVEILYLHPSMTEAVQENTELAKRFNEYFYGPMDYAILGWRR